MFSVHGQNRSNFSGPFRATRLWYQMIDCLRNGVVIKRHRHNFFKQYDNVFAGSNAVDVILLYLLQMGKEISNQQITRENAIKVCQVLMENFIFESVPYGSSTFEDNSKSLYRFTSEVQSKVQHENCDDTLFSKEGDYTNFGYQSTSPCNKMQSSPVSKSISYQKQSNLDAPSSIVRGKRRHSFAAAIRSGVLTDQSENRKMPRRSSPTGIQRHYSLRMSFTRHKARSIQPSKYLQKINLSISDVTEEIIDSIREKALSYLLTLVDIQILEPILNTPADMQRATAYEDALTIQNCGMKANEPVPKSQLVEEFERIPWVRAATACLTYIPEGIGNLWSVQACKLQCYKEVLEYYHNLSSPILPESLLSLYTAVLELHQKSLHNKALKALHLLIAILPWQRRDQLHKLLLFLQLVTEDVSASIEKEVTNRSLVLRDFTDCIFCHPLLSKDYCTSFLSLLLHHVRTVFQIPEWIHPSGITFCKPLSTTFNERNYTIQALKSLINFIINSDIPDKRRTMYLRKFKKTHQNISVKLLEDNNF